MSDETTNNGVVEEEKVGTETDTNIANPDNGMTNALNNAGGMLNKVSNTGKGLLDKWEGKGFIGAGAGLAASLFVFKSKSPIMMIAMTGAGFAIEKMIAKNKQKNTAIEVMPSAEISAEAQVEDAAKTGEAATTANNTVDRQASVQETENLASALLGMSTSNNRYESNELPATGKTSDELAIVQIQAGG